MAWGLPKLPGFTFKDPTLTQHQMKRSLRFYQGHRFADPHVLAPGGGATDVDSNAFALPEDTVMYDPSLTYGRVKQPALPTVIPHFVHYDKKCLNFTAFFKQPVYDSPTEAYRVRLVNIIYFIEDDSMTVMEPQTRNSGLWQGRLVTRGKIPKNDAGDYWHWKDLNVAKDICIYGVVYHTVSCDLYTKEWLTSQGIEVNKEEDLPVDKFTQNERWKNTPVPKPRGFKVDTLRRFLEYDGKVLGFDVHWDDRDSEYGELVKYRLFYFLQDDTISIKELHDGRGGKDPFPLLLKRMKIPKKWKEIPLTFPAGVMERSDEEVSGYYSPVDLIVGQTVFIFGRRFLITDCDTFTRNYYKTMLNIDQPPPVEIKKEERKEVKLKLPPHIGIGEPEDSLASCFGLVPKAPHKDLIKYNLNASKNLRYLCELEVIHPEDEGRLFILSYNLGDGKITISEIPRRNSGIKEGTFLKSMKLQTPESDPNFPTYYTPDKFYIGAVINVFKHRFKITGCDLFVYHYMISNREKFPAEIIDNVRNYHMREGNLKEELAHATREEQETELRAQLAKVGQAAVVEPSAMERCLSALNVVEGSASPPRPPTPPKTTDRLTYDETLRAMRISKPQSDDVLPLKGILKSGAPRDDHQKVVCFTGPGIAEETKPKYATYPPGEQPHWDDDPNFCDRYRDPDTKFREERREKNLCAYETIPKRPAQAATALESTDQQAQLPGYLGTYNVDCKQVPEYMRLSPDAYERVKSLRREVPEISPAATRIADYPSEPYPPLKTCTDPPPAEDLCTEKKEEDVAFACPHVQPKMPYCDPDKTVTKL